MMKLNIEGEGRGVFYFCIERMLNAVDEQRGHRSVVSREGVLSMRSFEHELFPCFPVSPFEAFAQFKRGERRAVVRNKLGVVGCAAVGAPLDASEELQLAFRWATKIKVNPDSKSRASLPRGHTRSVGIPASFSFS